MPKARLVFMGTPEYAVPALEALAGDDRICVDLVVTQPDRPQGRGRKLQSPAVKLAADRLTIPTLQIASLKSPDSRRPLDELAPDLIVVAAFGIILGPKTLNLPRLGCVNLHASLLPAYRGANPIAAAIAAGEPKTGVTLMRMDRGLDTGPILAMRSASIGEDDTTATMTEKLAYAGAELLIEQLGDLLAGGLPDRAQGTGATLTRPMAKNDGWIDWTQPAVALERHVRAMTPWPRSWTTFEDGTRLQILAASDDEAATGLAPGTIRNEDGVIRIATGAGTLILKEILLPGGKPLHGRGIVDRLAGQVGQVLGRVGTPEHLAPLVRELD